MWFGGEKSHHLFFVKPSLTQTIFSQPLPPSLISENTSHRGGLEPPHLAELSVTPFPSLPHCATLGKSHDTSEPQMPPLNTPGLYCGAEPEHWSCVRPSPKGEPHHGSGR